MTPLNLEKIYDDFEAAWNQQERPKIEEFLRDVEPNVQRVAIRELFAIELERRLSLGEMPELKDYLGRFTDFHSELRIAYREVMSQPEQGSNETLRIPRTTRFEPLERLGKGGQGEVWLSLDPNMGRRVALKILQPGRQGSEPSLSWFKRESEISGKLEHPNIVPVYDVSNELDQEGKVDPESPCFIMRVFGDQRLHAAVEAFHARARTRTEYPLLAALRDFESERTSTHEQRLKDLLGQFHFDPDNAQDQTLKSSIESILSEPSEAGTLEGAINRLHREGFSDSGLRKLLGRFQRICDGMAYAHSRGVIHRDLKPSNVMLGEYGETLIADWGLAKVIGRSEAARSLNTEGTLKIPSSHGQGELSSQGEVKGTLGWMPPEQASGLLDELGPTSDIYSLGAILYQILTGTAPHKKSDLKSIRRNEFPALLALNPRTPKALEAITLKAMATQAEHRYQTASALSSDIERWLSDEPVTAWHEPLTVRLKRWVRTHQTAAAAAIASLTMATIAALGWGAITSQHAADLRKERDKTKLAKELADDARILADDKAASEQRAKEKAELEEKNATEQKLRAQRLLVGISEENIARAMESQDYSEALSWSVLALKQLQDTPDREKREPIFRQRIGALLDEFPYLAHLLPLDGELIHAELVGDPQFLVTATIRDDELIVRTWDILTGQPVKEILWVDSDVANVSIRCNKDGSLIAVGYTKAITQDDMKFLIKIFDLKESMQLGSSVSAGGFVTRSRELGETSDLGIFELDPTGKYLLVLKRSPGQMAGLDLDKDRTLQVWDTTNLDTPITELNVGKNVNSIATDTGARLIAVGNDTDRITLWDRATMMDVTPESLRKFVKERGSPTTSICLSQDGMRLAFAIQTEIFLFDTSSKESLAAVIPVNQQVKTVNYTADREYLLVTSQEGQTLMGSNRDGLGDGMATVWSTKDEKAIKPISVGLRHKGSVTSLTWNPEQKTVVSGGQEGIVRSVFESYNNPAFPPISHASEIKTATLTGDGRHLITASRDGLVRIWKLDRTASGESRVDSSLEVRRISQSLEGRFTWVKPSQDAPVVQSWDDLAESYEPLGLSPDDRWLLTRSRRSTQDQLDIGDRVDSSAYSVQVWDVKTKEFHRVIPTEISVERVVFSKDGKLIAMINGEHPSWDPRRGGQPTNFLKQPSNLSTIAITNSEGEPICRIPVRGSISKLEFLDDGLRLLIGGADLTGNGAMAVFDTKTGKRVGDSYPFESPVINLVFDQSRKKFLVQLENMGCYAMSVSPSGIRKTSTLPIGPINRVAISPEGKLAALGTLTGSIEVHELTDELRSSVSSPALWKIPAEPSSKSPVIDLHFTSEGETLLAARQNGMILRLDIENGRVQKNATSIASQLHQTLMTEDSQRLVAIGKNNGIQIYEFLSGSRITPNRSIGLLVTSRSQPHIIVSSDAETVLCFTKNNGVNYFDFRSSILNQEDLASNVGLIALNAEENIASKHRYKTQSRIQVVMPYELYRSSLDYHLVQNPSNQLVRLLRGKTESETGNLERAIVDFNDYIEKSIGQEKLIGLEYRAKAHEELKQYELARRDYREMLGLSVQGSSSVNQKLNRAMQLLELDPAGVLEFSEGFKEQIEGKSKPEISVLKMQVALVECIAYARLNRYKEAIEKGVALQKEDFYEMMIGVQPVTGILFDSSLARIHQLAGDQDKFQASCESLLEKIKEPLGDTYQDELANLCVDNPKAIHDLDRLLAAMEARRNDNAFNPEFLGLLGGIELRSGRYEQAITTLTRSLDLIKEIPNSQLRKVTRARLLLLLALANHFREDSIEANKWRSLAEPILQAELEGPEPVLLQLNKPVLRRLHKELTEAMGASTKPNP
jgi:serine/threonine protein kinase/WD40 repeat protein